MTQVKKAQRIIHPCSRIVEQTVDVPVPQILEQMVIESETQTKLRMVAEQ